MFNPLCDFCFVLPQGIKPYTVNYIICQLKQIQEMKQIQLNK